MRALFLAGAALATLASAGSAMAHGPARTAGYISTVLAINPHVLGLSATVLGGDDKLSLRNWSGKTVVVLDASGAPMLSFGSDGVYRRRGGVWRLVNRGTSFAWHDPRIHWTGKEPPEVVRTAPERDHMIGPWRIPAAVDGRRVTIEGVIGWSAQPVQADDGGSPAWLVPTAVAGGLLAAASLAVPVFLLRRRRQSEVGPRPATRPHLE